MKAFDIALKDMKQSFRSKTAWVFMFGVPILMTTLFVFLFGGTGNSDTSFELPIIQVQVVNLDQGEVGMGKILADLLRSEEMADILSVEIVDEVAKARMAVDQQEADVAVIIPEDFTNAIFQNNLETQIEIYQDPTLVLGPNIVTGIISQIVNSFMESNIANGVAVEQLLGSGLAFDQEKISQLLEDYQQGSVERGREENLLNVVVTSEQEQQGNPMAGFIQMIMVGMMIFYSFFTGASTIQSVLREEENGTLPRLFTTATPRRTILNGKFLSSFVTVFIQLIVLLLFGTLVFGFSWGSTLRLSLVVIAITIVSATFGIFLISLLKNSKQAGVALGAGVTVTGMIGMSKIFTMSISNPPAAINFIPRLVPQGWALDALQIVIEGGSNQQLFIAVGGLLVWSLVFFFIGNRRFTRRYA